MFFEKIDTWILDRLEMLMWRVEYHTGKNNFFWARCSAAIGTVIPIIMGLYFFAAATLFYTAGIFKDSEVLERHLSVGKVNPVRYHVGLRLLGWLVSSICLVIPVSSLEVASIGWTFSVQLLSMYFLACSPMPPQWRREYEARKEYRKRLRAMRPA